MELQGAQGRRPGAQGRRTGAPACFFVVLFGGRDNRDNPIGSMMGTHGVPPKNSRSFGLKHSRVQDSALILVFEDASE